MKAIYTGLIVLMLGLGIMSATKARVEPAVIAELDGPPPSLESSVVKVLNADATGGGTGFVTTSSNGKKVIVTNDHVCEVSFASGTLRIEDDKGAMYLRSIVRRNFRRDLCVIEGIDAPTARIAREGPKRFDPVRVMGHPLLQPTSPQDGVFVENMIIPLGFESAEDGTCKEGSEPVQSIFGTYCILNIEVGYTTVPIWGGNSGSPIVNKQGEVIGVINSADRRTNQGNFVPLPYLKEILRD